MFNIFFFSLLFQGKHVIIAMAPSMSQRIVCSPSLPAKRNQLIQRAPMGSVMKCLVYYKKQFWKEKGRYSGIFLGGEVQGLSLELEVACHF